jgi:hypothetical protein
MRLIVLAFVLVALCAPAWAEDDQKASSWMDGFVVDRPATWEFEAQPYAWLFGNFGSATIQGRTIDIDVTPSDTWNLLTGGNAFAGSGYFALSYGRWSTFVDSSGGYAEESVHEQIPTQFCTLSVQAKTKLKYVITDAAFGYELGEWSLPARKLPFTLGVYAGMRYMWFWNRLAATAGVVHGKQQSGTAIETFEWADPLIGIRWSLPLLDSVSMTFRGDIGGFGASSQLIWGLATDARYWVPFSPFGSHPYVSLGYRAVVFDRASSPGSIDLQFRGPTAGAGFTF